MLHVHYYAIDVMISFDNLILLSST